MALSNEFTAECIVQKPQDDDDDDDGVVVGKLSIVPSQKVEKLSIQKNHGTSQIRKNSPQFLCSILFTTILVKKVLKTKFQAGSYLNTFLCKTT